MPQSIAGDADARGSRGSPTPAPGAVPARRRWSRLLWAATLLWIGALGGLLALFAFVGETAWPVVLLLYLPRHPWILPGLLLLPFTWQRGRRALLGPLAIGALIWLFPLMGFVLPGAPPPTRGPTLRVLSYNTGHTADGADGLRALLRDTRPDLVLFQWTSSLAEEALSGPGFEGWTLRREGQFSVASRYPILSVEAAGFPSEYGAPCAHAVVKTPLGTLDVYTMRPKSARAEVGATRGLGLRQRLREFVADLESGRLAELEALREAQTRSIAEEVARARHPVVIAGDSNLPDGSPLLRRTLGRFRDAFARAGRGFGYTFPAKLPWMRLDRVLLGPGLDATAFEVLPRLGAGHRAVLAEIVREPPT